MKHVHIHRLLNLITGEAVACKSLKNIIKWQVKFFSFITAMQKFSLQELYIYVMYQIGTPAG